MNEAVQSLSATQSETPLSYDQEREQFHRKMLSTVAHDIKTPIASIIGSLEAHDRMKHKLPPEKQAALLQVALSEAYRLDSFVTNILDMAKLESGMVKAKRDFFDLGAMLRDIVSRLGKRAELCTINITSDEKVDVVADSGLLTRVIGLVIDNALKHAGDTPVITIDYGKSGEKHFVTIRDNGPGIPAGQEKAVMEKYTRFAREGQHNNGMGLGLAVSYAIMQLLGGDLTATNHPQSGAVLSLIF